ncbi:MAG: right-handed parallel beta-helix repeat-containing protein [Planctomycetota bacterium]
MPRYHRIVVFAILVVYLVVLPAFGAIRYVKAGASGATNGTNWTDAYTSLQQALVEAVANDEIWVAFGTYPPSAPAGRAGTFQLRNDIAIHGGFRGQSGDECVNDATTRPPDNDPESADPMIDSILSGDLNGNDGPNFANNGDNVYHVVTGSGVNMTAILDRCAIQGGNANSASIDQQRGAGVFCIGGSPTLRDCSILNNSAIADGAGAHARIGSSPQFTRCRFRGNVATFRGGGLYAFSSSDPKLVDCVLRENRAGRGGGYYSVGTASDFDGCTFEANTATIHGGGAYCLQGSVSFTNCDFSSNSAVSPNPSGFGGAAFDDTAATSYTDCDFMFNVSADRSAGGAVHEYISVSTFDGCHFEFNQSGFGGALSGYNSSGHVTDSTFLGNTALVNGGALDNNQCESFFTDCTFEANRTVGILPDGYGGAAIDYFSASHFSNCAFRQNYTSSDTSGGGAFINTSQTTFDACLFDSNFAGYGAGIYNASSTTALTDCEFVQNSAIHSGGGCENYLGGPSLLRCSFYSNAADQSGAVGNYETSALFTECTFNANTATYLGGGVFNRLGMSTFESCRFENNHATGGFGGGAFDDYNTGRYNRCVFQLNTANASASGGGIYVQHGDQGLIANCTFVNNRAGWGGGVFDDTSTNSLIVNTGFFGNSALTNSGGGLNEYGGSTLVANCVFSGNNSRYGGAAYVQSLSTANIVNCTLSRNLTAYGAALEVNHGFPTVTNTILWGNTNQFSQGELEQISITNSGALDLNYCCVEFWSGSFGGVGNLGIDPRFRNSSGMDGIVGTADDDLRLKRMSPMIDAGRNAALPFDSFDLDGDANVVELLPVDVDGNPRFVDVLLVSDTGDGVAPLVDLGAYEVITGPFLGSPEALDVNSLIHVPTQPLRQHRAATHPALENASLWSQSNGTGSADQFRQPHSPPTLSARHVTNSEPALPDHPTAP